MRYQKQVKEVLNKTADVLEERGWCQFKFINDTGAMCAWGALQYSIYGFARPHECRGTREQTTIELEAKHHVDDYVKRKYLSENGIVTDLGMVLWNDRPKRTKEEMINLFREAADVIQ